jgi:hypothetical protein
LVEAGVDELGDWRPSVWDTRPFAQSPPEPVKAPEPAAGASRPPLPAAAKPAPATAPKARKRDTTRTASAKPEPPSLMGQTVLRPWSPGRGLPQQMPAPPVSPDPPWWRGGRLLVLEFSQVDIPGFDTIYDRYSFHVVPVMGKLVAGDAEPYRYLVESIRQFPRPDRFEAMIRDAGLSRVSHRMLTGGVAAIHSGWKL